MEHERGGFKVNREQIRREVKTGAKTASFEPRSDTGSRCGAKKYLP
jgi:hypothetical protein